MKEADAKAKIEAQGYVIDKFKVSGNCYEIYGKNKEGKKVEIYYDAKTPGAGEERDREVAPPWRTPAPGSRHATAASPCGTRPFGFRTGALAGLVLFDFIVDDGGHVHRVVGYVAAAVIRAPARLGRIRPRRGGVRRAQAVGRGTLDYLRGGARRTIGHDPLGLLDGVAALDARAAARQSPAG